MDAPKYRHQELESQTYFQETSYAKLSTNLLDSIIGNGAPFSAKHRLRSHWQ